VRPTERLVGPQSGGLVQPQSGPHVSAGYARTERGHRTWWRARWWLAGGKVYPGSTGGAPGWRRARRSGAALTRTAVRREGGGEASRQRRSSAGRELRWPVVMEAHPSRVGAEEGR
jgi:hypothetical protein